MNRRDFVKSASAFAAVTAAVGCEAETEKKGEFSMPVKTSRYKVAIVYFSRSGNTRYAATKFAEYCGGARVFEVLPETPYAEAYRACCDEAKPECEAGTLRPIKPIAGLDLAKYEVVLIGTPNWWGTMCPPIRTFVAQNAAVLKTKAVGIFQTHGGGGMQNVGRDFAKLVDGARVFPPKAFFGSTIKMGIGLEAYVTERLELV